MHGINGINGINSNVAGPTRVTAPTASLSSPDSHPTMTKQRETDPDPADDYRLSHVQRGGSYDATLSAGPFDSYMAQFEQRYLRSVLPKLFAKEKPRYLDFACGTGRITETVAPFCAESTGVDISPSMLDEARRKCPSARFVHADLTEDEVDLGLFDLITAFRFFGNAQTELRVAVLRTLHRLLRPNGCLIINSHRNPHSISALLDAMTGGSPSGMDLHYFKLKALLHSSGFEIVQSRPVGAWMYRFKLLTAVHDPARAERFEKAFGSSLLTPVAPDAIIVARKKA